MVANMKEDKKWSGVKKEGYNDLRTVERLRGRLLAERQASRAAKDDEQFMGNKLIELENNLRKEIELRNKAEKKLKFLMEKLESLNISWTPEKPDLSSSSESSGISYGSSSSSSSGPKDPEENESISQTANSYKNKSEQSFGKRVLSSEDSKINGHRFQNPICIR